MKTLDELEHQLDLSQDQQQTLLDFERRRQAFNMAVPTDDLKVRQRLRDLQEPQTLFGEGPGDRRDRLRAFLSKLQDEGIQVEFSSSEEEQEEEEEEFYTIGSQELLEARQFIMKTSLLKAQERIEMQKNELNIPFVDRKRSKHSIYTNLKSFATLSSQFGDDRPLTCCRFSPNSQFLATASWSGLVKLWNVPSSDCFKVFKGHKDRVSSLAFHPKATKTQSIDSLNFASSAGDGSVFLWSLNNQNPIAELKGHQMRVPKVEFHPSGRFIGTSSFDMTWRLWDAETSQELLLQEGHSKQVFALGFQSDGSLICTGDFDSVGRIWDLRTGKSVLVLKGHSSSILDLDWSPNGYQIATGSEDNTIRIWDIRNPGKFGALHTIPAHSNIVTRVKYAQTIDSVTSGSWLLSSSYDGTCKVWIDGSYKMLKSFTGMEGKIMCCDTSDGFIATAAYDRTFKLYASSE